MFHKLRLQNKNLESVSNRKHDVLHGVEFVLVHKNENRVARLMASYARFCCNVNVWSEDLLSCFVAALAIDCTNF